MLREQLDTNMQSLVLKVDEGAAKVAKCETADEIINKVRAVYDEPLKLLEKSIADQDKSFTERLSTLYEEELR